MRSFNVFKCTKESCAKPAESQSIKVESQATVVGKHLHDEITSLDVNR